MTGIRLVHGQVGQRAVMREATAYVNVVWSPSELTNRVIRHAPSY
jgi:hypothetical protein